MEALHGKLLGALPDARQSEITETLLETPGVRFERIVSHGQASPQGFWYDQQQAEWVCVLQGWGQVSFDNGPSYRLEAGDWLNIPAGARHRVDATAAGQTTVWLAVFHATRNR